MITGINHLTLAVREVDRSIDFYVNLLNCHTEARWDSGAYLSLGSMWLCLSLDESKPASDYTHIAFSVAAGSFADSVALLKTAGVSVWKTNSSEGNSFYFLDPDGHKLELHDGDLSSRLTAVSADPYNGWVRFKK